MRKCTVDGCGNKYNSKGFCARHYYQMRKHGETSSLNERHKMTPNNFNRYSDCLGIEIFDCKGNFIAEAFVDLGLEGIVKEHKWYRCMGYPATSIDRRIVFLHKIVSGNKHTDHIDRDKMNNRISNLRECTKSQNSINRGLHSNNKSGFTGISWHRHNKKWWARLNKQGRMYHLGFFDDIEDARRARIKAEEKIFGEYAPQAKSGAYYQATIRSVANG